MSAPVTPFSKVFDEIWNLLEANSDFTNIVSLGNRIKFNNDNTRDPLKENVASEDMPEVVLATSGAAINLGNTSSSTRVAQNYSLIVNTGDLRINTYINTINWLFLCCLSDWHTSLTALTWCGLPFVKTVRVAGVVVGQSQQERNRGITGWGAVWNIEVEMFFAKSSQLVFAEP